MRNLISGLFFFCARVAAAILQLKLVDRFFGSQYAGLSALLNQLAFYVALIELGLAAAAISLLYEPIQSRNHEGTSGLLYALQRDTSRLILFALPITGALVYGYSRSLHTSLPFRVIVTTLALTALSGLITLLSIHYQAYLNASEQIYQIYLVLGLGYLAKTVIGVGLAARYGNYLLLPVSIAALTVAEVFTMKWRFHRSFPHYIRRASRDEFAMIRSRAKYVLFHRVGGLIYYQSDFIILSLVASLALVKDYAQVQYAVAGLLGLSTAVFNALTASIARRQLDVSRETRWGQYRTVLRATYFLAIVAAMVFAWLAPTAVRAVFGGQVLPQRTYLLFGMLLCLNLIKQVDDTFITATGSFHVAYYLPILESSSYALLGIVLAKLFGIEGVVGAGVITNLLFAVIGKSIVVAHGILYGSGIRMLATKLSAAGIGSLLAVPVLLLLLFSRFFEMRTLLRVSITVVPLALYALLVAFLLVRRGYSKKTEPFDPDKVPTLHHGAA